MEEDFLEIIVAILVADLRNIYRYNLSTSLVKLKMGNDQANPLISTETFVRLNFMTKIDGQAKCAVWSETNKRKLMHQNLILPQFLFTFFVNLNSRLPNSLLISISELC